MQILGRVSKPLQDDLEALAIVFFQDDISKLQNLDKGLRDLLSRILGKDFKGQKNEIYALPTLGKLKPRRLILAGLGKKKEYKLDLMRQVAGAVSKLARKLGVKTLSWDGSALRRLPMNLVDACRAFAEGTVLGLYRFDKLKTMSNGDTPKQEIKRVELIFQDDRGIAQIRQALSKGIEVAQAVNFARDLVNSPANQMTPAHMAAAAQRMAKKLKMRCRVLTKPQIQRLGMNALLGVSRGSAEGPRFLILEYHGGKSSERPIVLIGKGITFDSGGISLKPAEGMEKMKYDMAGGAAVLGTFHAIARLKLPIHVVGLVPTCENLPSGSATKPGDVVTALNGKTIEVLNTDAEGRLILADALSYAARYKPRAAIDMATLTGACVVALGSQTCGLMGNDEKLIARIKEASNKCQERAWELPLWDEYAESIKSDIADVKNIGNREAGAITAASFLKKFVDGFPWAHLDIAGVAWEDSEKPYIPKGASGFGIRLMTTLLEDWSKKG